MKKIVVVDDNQENLEILTFILQDKGYHVISSKNPEILSDAAAINPAVILLDIWLGETNGALICQTLKASHSTKHIPVILVSGANNLPEIAKISCADTFLKKPYDLDNLLKMVTTLAGPAGPSLSVVHGGAGETS